MPILRLDGEIIGPVYVCFKETLGKLGLIVSQTIYKAQNMHVTCSKPGKLTKSHIKY
jgi:hypothetical protein